MSNGFKPPITIKEAIDKVYDRDYLLPAIQRKFTWSSEQIEMLFDSIMRDYPISSFMFWKVADEKIKPCKAVSEKHPRLFCNHDYADA